jgi:hypothetical protein
MTKGFDDQSKMDKSKKYHVESLDAEEAAKEAIEAAKQPLDLIAVAIHGEAVSSSGHKIVLGWNDKNVAKIKRQLPRVVSFGDCVKSQVNRLGCRSESAQKFALLPDNVSVAGGKRDDDRGSRVGHHQASRGAPIAARPADRLWAVAPGVPGPFGCPLAEVLSNDKASILTRTP